MVGGTSQIQHILSSWGALCVPLPKQRGEEAGTLARPGVQSCWSLPAMHQLHDFDMLGTLSVSQFPYM